MAKKYAEGETWKDGSSLKRERMEAYLEWVLTPEAARKPSTKTEFAASLDVTLQTLANYDKDRWFQSQYTKRSRGLFSVKRAQKVIDNLYSIAIDQEHKNAVTAARLLLEWMEKGQEQAEKSASDLPTDELIEIVMRREGEPVGD